MKLSKIQKLAQMTDGRMADNRYIINKREKGQPRFIKCCCCGKKFDLKDSEDYIGAINQWKNFGEKCYMCGRGFCHCKNDKDNKSD